MNNSRTNMLIPELRFPEFQDKGEWENRPIGEVTQVTAGATPSTNNPSYWGGDIPWMNSGELNLKRVYGVSNRITALGLKETSTKLIPPGCILIGLAGQGKTRGTVAINYIELCTNQSIATILPNIDEFVSEFLFHKLDSMYSYLRSLSKGDGGRGGLNLQIIKSVEIPLPDLEEQQKIADCLSSIDELIAAYTQKHEALKAHNKGLMQQLFPAEGETVPKLRFPEFLGAEEWGETKLGDEGVSEFIKDRIPLDQLDIESYISTENLLPEYAGVKTATKLPPSGSFTGFKKKDVLISNIRPYLKKIWQAQMDGSASNDVIVIRAKNKVIDDFLIHILRNDDFINYVMKGAKGVKMPRGDISSIKKYLLCYPPDKEQQKIADSLSSIDNLITAQAQKIESLKAHKKGLMQQLFPVVDEINS